MEQGALSADYNQGKMHFDERKDKWVVSQALVAGAQHIRPSLSESAPLVGTTSTQGSGWEHAQKAVVNNQTKIIQKEGKSISKDQPSSEKGEPQSNT